LGSIVAFRGTPLSSKIKSEKWGIPRDPEITPKIGYRSQNLRGDTQMKLSQRRSKYNAGKNKGLHTPPSTPLKTDEPPVSVPLDAKRYVIESSVLGENIVLCTSARDNGGHPRPDGLVIYSAREVDALSKVDLDPESVVEMHRVKKVFGGTVMEILA
jgi:hypothetical protein